MVVNTDVLRGDGMGRGKKKKKERKKGVCNFKK